MRLEVVSPFASSSSSSSLVNVTVLLQGGCTVECLRGRTLWKNDVSELRILQIDYHRNELSNRVITFRDNFYSWYKFI